MSTQDQAVITRVIDLDPDEPIKLVEIKLGGTFEFKLKPDKSKVFDHFEIVFDEAFPPNAGKHLKGTVEKSIFVTMPDEDEDFNAHIVFKKKDGTAKVSQGVPFLARTCGGCPGG
jgi:hypothetical protein